MCSTSRELCSTSWGLCSSPTSWQIAGVIDFVVARHMARFMVNRFRWNNQVAKHMRKDISLANLTCKYFCGEKPLANPTCKYFCGDTSRGKPQGNSFFFGKSGGQTCVQ